MLSVLRGLLQSPVSATSADNVLPRSAKTLHLRPRHYVTPDSIGDQSQRSTENDGTDYNNQEQLQYVEQKRVDQPDGGSSNSISNLRLESNISDEEFYQNNRNSNTHDPNRIIGSICQEGISKVGVSSDKFVRVKREEDDAIGYRNIKGVYYKYTIESVGGAWGQRMVQGGNKEENNETYGEL